MSTIAPNYGFSSPMLANHPFVGLVATGNYPTTRYPEPYETAVGNGPIVAYNGERAMILLDDGRIVEIRDVKLADPDAARAALLASRK